MNAGLSSSRLGFADAHCVSDEFCPHCDNHFVLEAKTPTPSLNIEGEDARIDARMIRDDRIESEKPRTIFNVKDAAARLG